MSSLVRRSFTAAVFTLTALVLVFALFHDVVYRWVAMRALNHVIGIESSVDGEFDVVHGSPLLLNLAKLRVTLRGTGLDTPRGTVGGLHLEVRLWPLFRRQIQIQKLYIRDADIELFSLGPSSTLSSEGERAFALPVVEDLRLENVTVGFRLASSGPRNELRVEMLEAAAGAEGNLRVDGSGSLDGDPWAIAGEFGSLGELIRPTAPFPVSVQVSAPTWGLAVDARGTVGAPLTGGDLALDLRLKTDDLAPLLDRLLPQTPFAGALDARARLSGSLDAPMLSDLELTLEDNQRFRLSVSGALPLTSRHDSLDVEVGLATADADVVRFLTADKAGALETLRLSFHARGEDHGYRLERVVGEVGGADDASARIEGGLRVDKVANRWLASDVAMDVSVDTPAARLAPWLPEGLPPDGRVKLVTSVSGDADRLNFERVVGAISDGDASVSVGGGLVVEETADGWRPSDIAVDVSVDTPAARLAPWLPEGLSSTGRATLVASVDGDAEGLRLARVRVVVTGEEQAVARLEGGLQIDKVAEGWQPSDIAVDVLVDAPVATFTPWLPAGVSSEGRAKFAAKATGDLQRLVLDAIEVDASGTAPLRGKMRGSAELALDGLIDPPAEEGPPTLAVLMPRLEGAVDIATRRLERVGDLLGLSLPALGSATLAAAVQGDGDTLRISDLVARVRGRAGLDASVQGALTVGAGAESGARNVDLQITARGPDAAAVASLGVELPLDPGPWTLSARLRGQGDRLRVGAVRLEAGSEDQVLIRVEGDGGDLSSWLAADFGALRGVAMTGRLVAASTRSLSAVLDHPVPELGRLVASFEARADASGWLIPSFDVVLDGTSALVLRAAGSATGLPGNAAILADVQVLVPDLSAAGALLGLSPPLSTAVNVKGRIEGGVERLSFAGNAELGSTVFDAQLGLDLAGSRPLLSGNLTTTALDAVDFGLASNPSELGPFVRPPPPPGVGRRLFDAKPLDFGLLGLTDLDLQISASEATAAGVDFAELRLRLENRDRRFHFEIDDIDVAEGRVTAAVDVDASGETPTVHLRTRSDGLSLNEVQRWFSSSEERMEGRFSHEMDLTASGHSPHELASTMSGRVRQAIVDGNLVGADLDMLDLHMMQLMVSMLSRSRRRTTVECIVADFSIVDGIATAEALFLETPRMFVAGTGTLDFSAETLELLLTAQPRRRRLFSRDNTFRVSGPMSALEVDADIYVRSAGTAAAAGMVVAPVLAPVAGFVLLGDLLGGRGESECKQAAMSQQ